MLFIKRSANDYIKFMLRTALEQVNYTEQHLTTNNVYQKIQNYVKLSDKGSYNHELVLKELLLLDEIRRGDVPSIINKKSRTGTSLVKSLTDMDLIKSDTPKGPFRLKFNMNFTSFLFPGLIR